MPTSSGAARARVRDRLRSPGRQVVRNSVLRKVEDDRARAASGRCAENRAQCIAGHPERGRCAENWPKCIVGQSDSGAAAAAFGPASRPPVREESDSPRLTCGFAEDRKALAAFERALGVWRLLPENTFCPFFSTTALCFWPANTLWPVFSTTRDAWPGCLLRARCRRAPCGGRASRRRQRAGCPDDTPPLAGSAHVRDGTVHFFRTFVPRWQFGGGRGALFRDFCTPRAAIRRGRALRGSGPRRCPALASIGRDSAFPQVGDPSRPEVTACASRGDRGTGPGSPEPRAAAVQNSRKDAPGPPQDAAGVQKSRKDAPAARRRLSGRAFAGACRSGARSTRGQPHETCTNRRRCAGASAHQGWQAWRGFNPFAWRFVEVS